MTKIAILGSTGSIGVNTLSVISGLKKRFQVTALAADSNIYLLTAQIKLFRPAIVSVGTRQLANLLKSRIPADTKIVVGEGGLKSIVSRRDVDLVVMAISGSSCLMPLVEAIKNKKKIALANKEAMVSAGPLIMKLAAKNGAKIIPVDSEHSAIFQCLNGNENRFLSRIYLTGSGGPLLNIDSRKFDSQPRDFILKHPKWRMGRKISVDSATMMNKGLEIIEAMNLFGIDEKFIEVLIHPEAVIHSMVEFIDGSVMAQASVPDMRVPIQYALTYPERTNALVKTIKFSEIGKLTFAKPDTGKFPCLEMARMAARRGPTHPAVLCAADEEVVKNYLAGQIKFSDIPRIIGNVLSRHKNTLSDEPTINDILRVEDWARREARSLCYL